MVSLAEEMKLTPVEKADRVRNQLESEFENNWKPQMVELAQYISPLKQRFLITDHNTGKKQFGHIVDPTATLGLRTAKSGMMSGITSPSKPWMRLSHSDPEVADSPNVRTWLATVTRRMLDVFSNSNVYKKLPNVYGDLVQYSTAAMEVLEDPDEVIRVKTYPMGSYAIANDARGRVNTCVRSFIMTARQVLERFGEDNISETVKSYIRTRNFEAEVEVVNVIMPNSDFDPDALESNRKKFVSLHYEKAFRENKTGQFLSESGFDEFPVMAPRWDTTGEDVYGSDGPGMIALGDIKQLQHMQKKKAQAREKGINPPMTGPASLKSRKKSILPGSFTAVDTTSDKGGFRAAHQVVYDINGAIADIQEERGVVNRSFFVDLFLLIAMSDRREVTAREVEEKHEEKLLMLGPMLENVHGDLLSPLIDRTFSIMLRRGMFPPIPDELRGETLKVEFVSILAQAQKLVGLGTIDRFVGNTVQLAQAQASLNQAPEAMDKVNVDGSIDAYADLLSIDPDLVNDDEEVDAIRSARAQAQAQAAAQAQAREAAETAQTLGKTPMDDRNALTQLLGQEVA